MNANNEIKEINSKEVNFPEVDEAMASLKYQISRGRLWDVMAYLEFDNLIDTYKESQIECLWSEFKQATTTYLDKVAPSQYIVIQNPFCVRIYSSVYYEENIKTRSHTTYENKGDGLC